MNVRKADVIVIGSGLAGLMVADILSMQKNVIIITKSSLKNSNSMMAQGGIAAAVDREDNWRDHFFDTVVAGGFHNVDEVTEKLVRKGPQLIKKLIELGVSFDKNIHGEFSLGREGAHGKRRILHSGGDATGKALVECLLQRVEEKVTIYEYEMAMDLLVNSDNRCIGVWTKNEQGESVYYYADRIILASGGAGQLYPVTSNDHSVTGDGIAMAYRAGAELCDLEFIQFHPTMLVKNGKVYGLVSEAVRGEGARLVTESGKLLMEGVHELKDLAPRDIVAREIHYALQRNEQLYLDISSITDFTTRFPSITAICQSCHIDLEHGLIPVATGAHFIMGGVKTDQCGKTTIPGIYAVGEVAHTGVHGANRLASNSLLEAIVFASEVANDILATPEIQVTRKVEMKKQKSTFQVPSKSEIQNIMMSHVGIIRSEQSLVTAKQWFLQYESLITTNQSLDLTVEEKTICNMLTVGNLVTSSALLRTESRGGHFRLDYPLSEDWSKKQIVRSKWGTKLHSSYQEELVGKASVVM